MRDPWVWPDNPAYPPWPHLRYPLTSKDEDPNKKLLGRVAHECRGHYCFISPTQHTMHYFTKNTPPNPTTKGTLYRVPSGQDPWVLPAKPDIPPMAAPPEASYRRPEDNIVLSRPPSIPCTTSHKTCQQLPYNKRHPLLEVPSGQDPWVLPAKPDIPPTAAPPLPPHLNG